MNQYQYPYLPEVTMFDRLRNRLQVFDGFPLRKFFWSKKKAERVSDFLLQELDEVIASAKDGCSIIGYRGYVVDLAKHEIKFRSAIYPDQDELCMILEGYQQGIADEYTNPEDDLAAHIVPIRYATLEPSEGDVLDDCVLRLKNNIEGKKVLYTTAMTDILDILFSLGVVDKGRAEDIEQ